MSKGKLAAGFALPSPPRRSDVREEIAQRFERVELVERSTPPRPPSRLRRETLGERLAIYVPPELAETLRVRCARERRSISDAMTEALELWMKSHGTREA